MIRCVVTLCLGLGASLGAAAGDVNLSYVSAIDGTTQPYRVYVPSAYRGDAELPLVIALHETDGDEHTFFERHAHYPQPRGLRAAAEHFGMLVACPRGRGNSEFRGIGENDVFCVLEDVSRRFRIDRDRVHLTGHSMGGGGAAYLALHHPDVFATVAPLAGGHGYVWLAPNARHLPVRWSVGGRDDAFRVNGIRAGVERMRQLGAAAELHVLPDEDHYGPARDFFPVLAWMLPQQRRPTPREFTFVVDTIQHRRAYWIAVETIAQPGELATVHANADSRHSARLDLDNIAALSFRPTPDVFDLANEIVVRIGADRVFGGRVGADEEVVLTRAGERWGAAVRKRQEIPLTAYRTHPVAVAPEQLDMTGLEAPLANWVADAMRHATGAELALYNRIGYRGYPIPAGVVDVVDLVQCSLPSNKELVTVVLSGRDVLEILEANIELSARDGVSELMLPRLAQISGGHYAFDRSRPPGRRIVASSLVPDREYLVALEARVVERETLRLAGRFKRLPYRVTASPQATALYGYAVHQGRVSAPREGRVRDVTNRNAPD